MVGHRATLVNGLYGGCKSEQSIKFNFGTTAKDVVTFSPRPCFTATPRNGDAPYQVEADVLLAADGVKSPTRKDLLQKLGLTAQVQETGQAAYRIMLTRDQLAHDSALLSLLDADKVTRWIGEKRHIIAYPGMSARN